MEDNNSVNAKFDNLLYQVRLITESYERIRKISGENFNIFSILKMESKEDATHSSFIAELLNPHGKHGQNDIFLKLFIETIKLEEYDFHTSSAKINCQHYIGKISPDYTTGGIIDILIQDNTEKVIMIENKINHTEGEKQLLRYHNAYPNGELLFLTLNGEASTKSGLTVNQCKPISYREHIITWLEKCKKESASYPILRESITQYINLIKNITNQNTIINMEKDIISTILRDVETLKTWRVLVDNKIHEGVKKQLLVSILLKLQEHFDKNHPDLKIVDKIDVEKKFNLKYSGVLIELENYILKKNNLTFKLNFETNSFCDLIFGLFSKDEKGHLLKDLFVTFRTSGYFVNVKNSPGYPVYAYFEADYRNWYTLTLARIYFQFDDFALSLDNKINQTIELLEKR